MAARAQVRYSFPAWRVFVFGVEVTNDVVSCNINWHDGRSPGTAEFVLSSELDRYVTTLRDIYALYDDVTTSALQNGIIDEEVYERRLNEVLTKNVLDPIKRRVLLRKVLERVKDVDQPALDEPFEETASAVARNFKALSGEVARFPFQVGQCIFHSGDPVRVFWRDPFDATTWYFAATGTVSDWKEAVDASGRRAVTITVEDATRPFRMARIALNPAIYDTKVVADARFDYLIRNWHVDTFQNLTLPEMMFTVAFGGPTNSGDPDFVGPMPPPVPFDQYRYGVHGKTSIPDVGTNGVGFFNREESQVYTYGPTGTQDARTAALGIGYTSISSLEEWQEVMDHQVPTDVDDFVSLAIPEKQGEAKATFASLETIDDIIKEIGEHPEVYPVDFGRLLMLVPSSLGPAGNLNIFLKDYAGIADQTEFLTRLQIIYAVVQRLNFSFYATPRGDIVCEMPLYSFRPEDFGHFAARYVFPTEDMVSFGSHFQHDKVRTLMVTDRSVLPERNDTGLQSQLWFKPGSASLRALIPQFGIVMERAEPWSFRNSPESAKYYCELKLSQLNAEAWQQEVSTVIHMGVGPNRPCYFEARDFIATTRSVAGAIAWGPSGSVTQQLKLNYRRGWSGLLTPNKKHVYEPYGGLMTNPLDFSMIFREKSNESETSTKQLAGTKSFKLSSDEQKQLEKNESFMREQIGKLAEQLSVETGKSIRADDLMGSFTRDPVTSAAVKGKENSMHLSGLAIDIPKSKLDALNRNLGTNLTVQGVEGTMKTMMKTGSPRLAQGHIESERGHIPNDPNPDHVHYELFETSKHRKIHWEPGEDGGQ